MDLMHESRKKPFDQKKNGKKKTDGLKNKIRSLTFF